MIDEDAKRTPQQPLVEVGDLKSRGAWSMGVAYCVLLEEILVRDELLVNVLHEGVPEVDALRLRPEMQEQAAIEFAYLQLRMICETIALACLTVHGEIRGAAKIKAMYEADKIIKRLGQLHPNFYPRPTKQASSKDEFGVWRNHDIASGFLTREELRDLYIECGGTLHRGRLKDIGRKPPERSRERALRWSEKIWMLLEHHVIQTIDEDVQFIALMKDRAEQRPQIAFATLRQTGLWEVLTTARANELDENKSET